MTKTQYLLAAAAVALILLWRSFFCVRETEFVLVTQFGRPLWTSDRAGLYTKWFFQTANYFDRRLRVYDPRPAEFLTRDKKNLVIESYVVWNIESPGLFLQTVGDPAAAETRLHDIVWSGLSAVLGTHDLEDLVSVNSASSQGSQFLDGLAAATGAASLARYGIRITDIRIKRLNLPEQNKQSVYARMRAERERIARQYRAEGEEQAMRIRAAAERERDEILSAAYRDSEKVKGEGDAAAARIYGQAYSRDPKLYKLLRTLESYRKVLDEKTTAILSSDSELMKVLTHGEGAVQ